MLYNVVLNFKSVREILMRNHSNMQKVLTIIRLRRAVCFSCVVKHANPVTLQTESVIIATEILRSDLVHKAEVRKSVLAQ